MRECRSVELLLQIKTCIMTPSVYFFFFLTFLWLLSVSAKDFSDSRRCNCCIRATHAVHAWTACKPLTIVFSSKIAPYVLRAIFKINTRRIINIKRESGQKKVVHAHISWINLNKRRFHLTTIAHIKAKGPQHFSSPKSTWKCIAIIPLTTAHNNTS